MKRIILIILAAAAIIAGSVSCSKVNDIDKRLTQLEQTVSDLKAQVLAGAVITSVEKTADGCTFTLSNGQSYIVTNGKDGTDGEAIIADVKIEEDFVVLTLKNGEILRISYQNPLSMVTLSIVPDYDDGTVKEPKTTETMGTKSHNFYLDVAVTPAKYAEILVDTERFIHKAVFSPVQTKSGFGNALTVSPKSVAYADGAPVPFLETYFELDDETAALLQSSAYTVSYSIEDKDGVHGAATVFVAISNDKGSGGDGSINFVVLSDIHLMHPDLLVSEGEAFDKYNWEECKLLRESPEIFEATLKRARAYNPDFVIVCGDMTKDGEIISHKYVADRLNDFSKRTGAKILVVPGNHDLTNPHSFRYDGAVSTPEPSATKADFEQIYAQCGYDDAVERGPRKLDYMSYPADGIAFIGVDSNEKNTPDNAAVQGGLTKDQTSWVSEMVKKAHADNRYVIMGMHHNLLDFYNNASLIRGANIANARYEDYSNEQLVTDLCNAGIDVVFSGHSHMHSITSEKRGGREIFSVVTSSLVNLPLAYRTGSISKDGLMTMKSGYVQDVMPSNGVNLIEEGKRYWLNLSGYYMYEASRVCWENDIAKMLVSEMLGLQSREEVEKILSERAKIPFYNFTYYTSNGNEHLFDPDKNSKEAKEAIDGVLDYVIDGIARKWMEEDEELSYEEAVEGATESVNFMVTMLLGKGLDDAKAMLYDFLDSAYHNYYGTDHTPVPDDFVTLQLSKR